MLYYLKSALLFKWTSPHPHSRLHSRPRLRPRPPAGDARAKDAHNPLPRPLGAPFKPPMFYHFPERVEGQEHTDGQVKPNKKTLGQQRNTE